MHFLFEEFDHIYVSFSGGKDSGLLLNLVLDYRNQHYPERAIGGMLANGNMVHD